MNPICIPVTCTFIFLDPVTTPELNIVVQKQANLYITLSCISFNGTLPINYTFFKKGIALSPVISKDVREPAEFNLTKSNTREGEEYRCEAKNSLPDYARNSHPATMPSTSKDYLSSFHRVWICSQKRLLPVHFPLWPPASKCFSFGRVHTNCDGIAFCHKNKTKKVIEKPRHCGRKGPCNETS